MTAKTKVLVNCLSWLPHLRRSHQRNGPTMRRVSPWTGWSITTSRTTVKTCFPNDRQIETPVIRGMSRPTSTPTRLVLLHSPIIHSDLRLHHLQKLERLVWPADAVFLVTKKMSPSTTHIPLPTKPMRLSQSQIEVHGLLRLSNNNAHRRHGPDLCICYKDWPRAYLQAPAPPVRKLHGPM